jgi:hypothetical protein
MPNQLLASPYEKLDGTLVEVNESKRELGTYRCTARLRDVETSREQCKGAGLHLSRVVGRHLVTVVLVLIGFEEPWICGDIPSKRAGVHSKLSLSCARHLPQHKT